MLNESVLCVVAGKDVGWFSLLSGFWSFFGWFLCIWLGLGLIVLLVMVSVKGERSRFLWFFVFWSVGLLLLFFSVLFVPDFWLGLFNVGGLI